MLRHTFGSVAGDLRFSELTIVALLGHAARGIAPGYAHIEDDARRATDEALADLDACFFHVRFDRLTPAEKAYMRDMADLRPGPDRSGDIADRLGRKVTTAADPQCVDRQGQLLAHERYRALDHHFDSGGDLLVQLKLGPPRRSR